MLGSVTEADDPIETQEVALDSNSSTKPPGELGRRLGARAIDAVVLTAAAFAIGSGIGFGFDWLILVGSLVLVYFVLADCLLGATLGKALLGLRVQGPSGGRPTLAQAAVREAFTVVGAVPFIGPIVAMGIWIGIALTARRSASRQGFHDRLAGGTRVVRLVT